MSFGINGPDNNIPAIQKSHHTNDGGAGNLGYFQQEKKKKEKEKEKKEEQDVFEFSSKSDGEDKFEQDENTEEKLDSIGTKIKNFWLNLNKNTDEENPEDK
ncbi:MAG: hypothetical protein LUH05_06015 [Candidatus Gastranaerophilales bacterium]|nr:hypothetical protein [Candidatus Gastranaerophilales bacterium]